jgi:primosomal replication protein N
MVYGTIIASQLGVFPRVTDLRRTVSMPRIRQLAAVPVLAFALIAAAACGGKSPTSPSPPSGGSETPAPAPAPAPSPAGRATIAGQVVAGTVAMDTSSMSPIAGVTVTVSGTSISTLSDGSGRFSLSNVPAGDRQVEFEGHGVHARVTIEHVEEQEEISVTVVVAGNNAQVMEQERVTGAQAQLEGTITDKSESARTLEVHGVTVKVPSEVPIRHGSKSLTFANLHSGDRVHIKGSKDGDSITATEVNVQKGEDTPGNGNGNDDDDNDDHGGNGNGNDDNEHANEVELTGTPSGLSGSCPNLTFTLEGKTVTTGEDTEFRKGTCEEFKTATKVEAEGILNGNTVAARKVSIEKD